MAGVVKYIILVILYPNDHPIFQTVYWYSKKIDLS